MTDRETEKAAERSEGERETWGVGERVVLTSLREPIERVSVTKRESEKGIERAVKSHGEEEGGGGTKVNKSILNGSSHRV